MRGRGAPGGQGIRTADATGGSSCHPPDRLHELATAVPEGIGGRYPVFLLIRSHGGVHFVPRHVLMIDSDAGDSPSAACACGEVKSIVILLQRPLRPCDCCM